MTSLRWRILQTSTVMLLAVASACTPTVPAAHSTLLPLSTRVNQQAPSSAVSGVPNQPDLVTVIPFVWKANETYQEQTKVIIPGELNGRRGNFVVDLGDPDVDLNRTFLRPTPTGEIDTVLVTDTGDSHHLPAWDGVDSGHAMLCLGTLKVDFVDPTPSNPAPHRLNAFLDHQWGNFVTFAPRLGNIGLSALEQFETIIDYTHRRLVLIRLDNAGHRLVDVPAYTPKWSVPLIDIPLQDYPGKYWWGLAVRSDNTLDTLNPIKNTKPEVIDTGAPGNWESHDPPLLGYPFLRQFGVVGFNHRTHQFILYR